MLVLLASFVVRVVSINEETLKESSLKVTHFSQTSVLACVTSGLLT